MADTSAEPAQAPATEAAPSGGVSARAASRAATIAAMEAGEHTRGAPAEAAPAKPAADASVEAPVDEPSATVDDSADASAPTDEAPVEAAKPAEEPKDAETAKRLDAVQKAEKRAREALAKERAEAKAEIDRERAEMRQWKAERDAFEAKRARAKYDADVAAELLGLSDDEREPLARDMYARSKGAATDPKNRDAAIKYQRDRELADRLAAVEKRNTDLEAKLTQQTESQRQEAAFAEHVASVRKVANGTTPLFEKAPAVAHAAVAKVTLDLWEETGEYPDAHDVVATLEKRLPDMLTVAQYRQIYGEPGAKPAAPTKPANANATAPKATLGADMTGATTVPKDSKKSLAEQRAETTRLMEQGKFE